MQYFQLHQTKYCSLLLKFNLKVGKHVNTISSMKRESIYLPRQGVKISTKVV